MVVLHDGEVVTPDMLPPPLDRQVVEAPPSNPAVEKTPPPSSAPEERIVTAPLPAAPPPNSTGNSEQIIRPLAEMEQEIIERAIGQCNGNIPKAAAHLGISASTIYRKRAAWQDALDVGTKH